MTLEATISTKLVRLPEVERGDSHPLDEGTNTLPQGLRLRGTPEDPDVFDIQDRVALHTVDDSPQTEGRRYADLERVLAQREGIERVTGEDGGDSGSSGTGGGRGKGSKAQEGDE